VIYRTVIRLGPLFTADALERAKRDEILPGRWYYNHGGLKLLPDAAVLVNHDDEQRVGTVDELDRFDDGQGEWLIARCTIFDAPPWLTKTTCASIGFTEVQSVPLGRGTRFGYGFVQEVSLVSPSKKPREGAARILLLREVTAVGDTPGVIRRDATGEVLAIR
jgi:hypothetical protein